MVVNIGIWFWMWNSRAGFEEVSTSFRKVVIERQYYRVITATFTHLSLLHLFFNMASLWSVGMMEVLQGSYWYLETTILLILVSEVVWMGATYALLRWTPLPPALADASAVGYSGVLFGWMALTSVLQPGLAMSFVGLSVPMWIAPWASLLITQVIMPRASFMGHLTGILAGYAIAAGAFAWLSGYWFWTTVAYAAALIALSLRANSSSATAGWLGSWLVVSPAFVADTGLGASVEAIAAALAAAPGGGTAPRRYVDNGVLRVARGVQPGAVEDAPETGAGGSGGASGGTGAALAPVAGASRIPTAASLALALRSWWTARFPARPQTRGGGGSGAGGGGGGGYARIPAAAGAEEEGEGESAAESAPLAAAAGAEDEESGGGGGSGDGYLPRSSTGAGAAQPAAASSSVAAAPFPPAARASIDERLASASAGFP